ncbi:MAG: hypothetical protein M5R40_18855 [Anaerolineae bacterium]|nr:hypothetical protein [Anaerolineae bacterium]
MPVWVTKITTGQWSYEEPIATPSRLLLQIYWQMMPGERREGVDAEFHAWLDGVIASRPAWYEGALHVETEYVVRFMPGTMMAADHPFVQAFAGAVGDTLDIAPQVVGAPFPCDLFAIQQDANTPALVFGPQGEQLPHRRRIPGPGKPVARRARRFRLRAGVVRRGGSLSRALSPARGALPFALPEECEE